MYSTVYSTNEANDALSYYIHMYLCNSVGNVVNKQADFLWLTAVCVAGLQQHSWSTGVGVECWRVVVKTHRIPGISISTVGVCVRSIYTCA